jgi:serine/threonine protein kinase
VVRDDHAANITISICRQASENEYLSRFEGRDKLRELRLPRGEVALIRPYRHGGLLRGLTGKLFFVWPPRPFRELVITEELRRRGVPTVEVYGACVEAVWGPFYRGWLVTRELAGAEDLWAVVQSGRIREPGGEEVLRAVARSLRMLHREGVYHRDLNLKNILVRREASRVTGYIIDFDKAKVVLGHVPGELAKRNLKRVLRSIRKLDPERRYFSDAR